MRGEVGWEMWMSESRVYTASFLGFSLRKDPNQHKCIWESDDSKLSLQCLPINHLPNGLVFGIYVMYRENTNNNLFTSGILEQVEMWKKAIFLAESLETKYRMNNR